MIDMWGDVTLPKNITDFLADLIQAYDNTNIASKENRIKSLELIVEEQRRDYDYLLHIYNRLRATESVLLTAAFGIIAYLYNPASNASKPSIAKRLFVPGEDYGKVIYFIAAAFFFYAVLKLTLTVFGDNPWETVYETPKDNYTHQPLDTLEYVKNRHDICQKKNSENYMGRKKQLVFLFYCILLSAIILIVIKTLK